MGHRCGSDPGLLWLWRRLAAVARIRPLAWEPPYDAGVGLKRQKKKGGDLMTVNQRLGIKKLYCQRSHRARWHSLKDMVLLSLDSDSGKQAREVQRPCVRREIHDPA